MDHDERHRRSASLVSVEGAPVEGDGLVPLLGLVYRDLDDHRRVLHALGAHAAVKGVEFSVQAPLYKANPAIVDGVREARGLADKIDIYFRHALCDEPERVRLARMFAVRYAQKHPRHERQDLFLASGDVLGFTFDLVPPMQLPTPRAVFDAMAAGPHDAALLARVRAGETPARWHLRVRVRLFLDHALNPRRHREAGVVDAMGALQTTTPFVLEASVSPSLPGYAHSVLEPLVRAEGGRVAWLEA